MKLLIASDIHGDYTSASALAEAYSREKADKLILLGDLLYHGPRNDLPKNYAPKKVASLLNSYKNEILAVRGNCDSEVDQMMLDFPILAEYAFILDGSVGIFATHGHKYNLVTPPSLKRGEILLHGHTHIPSFTPFGENNLYVNPGSVSMPKENNPKTYMIYENRTFTIKELDGTVITAYSI